MEALKALPDVTKLSDTVTRILGQNPGKFTLQGTNTYLVGKSPPFILIDTGEGRSEYVSLLENVLRSTQERQPAMLVSDIIITHRHRDHFGGLPDVLNLLRKLHEEHGVQSDYIRPRIHKHLTPEEPSDSTHEIELRDMLSSLPSNSYQMASPGSSIHELKDLQQFETCDTSVSLKVIHTPGHTPDSVCLLLQDAEDPNGQGFLFTADSVLGQGTAVFEDLGAYIQSLQRLLMLREDPDANANFKIVYPGHGPVVEDGPELISTYIKHRLEREAQILDILSNTSPREGNVDDEHPSAWSIWDIVRQIYKDYSENLWLPAAHGVGLHLRKLEKDGQVACVDGDGINQRWMLLSKL